MASVGAKEVGLVLLQSVVMSGLFNRYEPGHVLGKTGKAQLFVIIIAPREASAP